MADLSNLVIHRPLVDCQSLAQLNAHRSVVFWFTGLSVSGKSILANSVDFCLHQLGLKTFVLDGDNVRDGFCSDLGFSDESRSKNIRRVGHVSRLFGEAGMVSLCAFISPFGADRSKARAMFPKRDFYEIYCKSSLAACDARDLKGLYKRAREGAVKNFTGILALRYTGGA